MKEEEAAVVFAGGGKEAGAQKCIPRPSKSISTSGKEISENEVLLKYIFFSSIVIIVIELIISFHFDHVAVAPVSNTECPKE